MKELINDWAKFYGIGIHSIEATESFYVIAIYEMEIILERLDGLRSMLKDNKTGWRVFSIDASLKTRYGLEIWLCLE